MGRGWQQRCFAVNFDINYGHQGLFDFEDACIAEKMSWVAKRETTTIEGMTYCPMGLFNVHMLILHGEGKNA